MSPMNRSAESGRFIRESICVKWLHFSILSFARGAYHIFRLAAFLASNCELRGGITMGLWLFFTLVF